ncbi:Os03g0655850 [Oryza sativa Japonica Group]|uniref:Os03g0655850 protein n=1 Tax=Oryza sativa subsp. japonica TaxID=39947 RepID=A0A0P0W0Y5_ORYSJ|nr:hypothetical protein EE612_019370 [Oryza sativa]BAS85555.1 Os03g0655850 [Oryza sativa Japonica Group]
MCDSSMSGNSEANEVTRFLQSIDAYNTFALSTEQSFPRLLRATSNATRDRITSEAEYTSVLKPVSSPLSFFPKPLGWPKYIPARQISLTTMMSTPSATSFFKVGVGYT